MRITRVVVSMPFGLGSAEWNPDPAEKQAAWELYVELVTRVTVQQMEENQGLTREALNSLHSLFGSTREILRRAGPQVGAKETSVGGLAIKVLNYGLRPFLSKWHPLFSEWETRVSEKKPHPEISEPWPLEKKFRADFVKLQKELSAYSDALSKIAEV